MKEIVITTLKLTNFKGVQDLSIDFNSIKTEISGANGTGKSTILAAYTWLLFGKDQFDRTDHKIIRIENGSTLTKIDAEVEATFGIKENGKTSTLVLKRIYKQNWTRPRGEETEIFSGHTTSFFINGSPVKTKKEYDETINSIIPENLFKIISHPGHFFALPWKEQRNILFSMSGEISNDEIAQSHPELADTILKIQETNATSYATLIKEQKKKNQILLNEIPAKIEQTKKLMPETQDWGKIEAKIKELKKEIEKTEDTSDKNKIAELKQKLKDIEFTIQRNFSEEEATFAQSLHKDKLNLMSLQNSSEELLLLIQKYDKEQEQINSDINAKRKEFHDVNSYSCDSDFTCPYFNIKCDSKEGREINSERKEKKLQSINQEGKALKEKQIELETLYNKAKTDSTEYLEKIKTIQSVIDIKEKNRPIKPELKDNQEYAKTQKELEQLLTTDSQLNNNDSQRLTIESQLNQYESLLNNRNLIKTCETELQELQSTGKQLSSKIAADEKEEDNIGKYNRIYADISSERINNMFNIVKFQLYTTTLEGAIELNCIAIDSEGVAISSVNNAKQINMSLDVIKKLNEFYGISAPVIIDNAESINELIELNSQLLTLKVTNDKKLVVNN